MTPSSKARRILLLDDHPGSCSAMCFVLRMRGHTCMPTVTLDDAIAQTAAFVPDVIIYEWQLARERLHGIARALRTHHPSQRALMIVMSVIEEPVEFRAREEIDAYFTKPVNMQALDSLLADWG